MITCKKCGSIIETNRSNQQNKSYWKLCVEPLADHLQGYTQQEIHEILKYKFLRTVSFCKDKDGNVQEVVYLRSTTTLTKKEFCEYMENIRIWASSIGCFLYQPNEGGVEC